MTFTEQKNYNNMVVETYMESIVWRRSFPENFEKEEHLEPILKFLIKQKRITIQDLRMDFFNTLYEFRLRSFINRTTNIVDVINAVTVTDKFRRPRY